MYIYDDKMRAYDVVHVITRARARARWLARWPNWEAAVARAAFRARRTFYNFASPCVCAYVWYYIYIYIRFRCTRIRLRVIRAASTPSDSLDRRRAYRIIILLSARGAYNGGGGKFIIIIVLFSNRSHSRSPSVARQKPRTSSQQ